MKQENDIPDKILERIRKLIRLKESTTSEGEAKAAATHVNRLLKEYNLSLLDVNEKRPEAVFEIRESGAISYKDAFGNYWKRDLLRVLCEYNYCRMLRYQGSTNMLIVGTQENIAAVTVLYDYLRTAFRRLADKRHMEYVSTKRGYYRTEKYRKKYIRSYLEGVTPGLRGQFEAMRSTSAEEVRETALVHCHNALIERYLETIGTSPSKVQPRKAKTDYSAYSSGMGDGRNISLNRQISGGDR
ncbi:DUF2786 domain-containing protein [Bacteroides fragilis]|uniref:DUF2786 domain-containing protein n=1 Tax=Bacteroides fragilis TaxID=817 RepID=UPI001C6FD2C2|nr:DUF2786 domain-containing protein [Bacteroides fragilis]MBW9280371.1 DUF2786 domain-containing protein [Bacteroides fragilis]